jgi:hypothetical protein
MRKPPPNAGKGRKLGSKNKKTAEVREAARVYTSEALRTLVRLMRGQNVKGKGRSEVLPQTQAFAADAILNRAYGRPATAVVASQGTGPARVEITWVDEYHDS